MRIVPARSLAQALVALLLPVTVLGLTGCAGTAPPTRTGSAAPSSTPAPLASTDQTFLAGLLTNHRRALEVSALLGDKHGVDPQVQVLADEVSSRQQGVVDRLQDWPVPVDPGSSSAAPQETLPQAELDGLAGADGPQSGRIYLQAMVGSHIEAVRLARTEVAQGSDPEAIALAQEVIATSSAEMDRMRVLLGGV